jgi:hypothetical protein
MAELRAEPKLHATLGWSLLRVESPSDEETVRALEDELNRGEAEAIALALELRALLVLIDEKLGREVVIVRGLRITGLLGVRLRAKLRGRVPSARGELERPEQAGFWISTRLRRELLKLAGEGDREPLSHSTAIAGRRAGRSIPPRASVSPGATGPSR